MHVDETTQALKLREVLAGSYHYDPVDHHGPTLLYSTVPLMKLTGTSWEEMTESGLRRIPALYGVALLLLLVLIRDGFDPMALGWAAVFTAVSPLMVFYSRYFIMEILLVVFTFGCIACAWRFFITRKTAWIAWSGVCAGLMHATKETCVLHFAAMGAGLLAVWIAEFFSAGAGLGVVNRNRRQPVTRRQLLCFVAAAVLTSVTIFSQFFTEWRGVADSIGTYFRMLGRAGGEGHEKAFGYYTGLLWGGSFGSTQVDFPWTPSRLGALFSTPGRLLMVLGLRADGRIIVLSEALIVIFALGGCLTAFTARPSRNRSNHLIRFFAVYSVALFLIYSLIRYKTPWCIMSAWHGLIIMAGFGAARFVGLFWSRPLRLALNGIIALGAVHLALQSWRATRDFAALSANPYNYSMTSRDALDAVQTIRRLATLDPAGDAMVIQQDDLNGGWPLPWFLARQFPNYQWQGGAMEPDKASVLLLSGAAERRLDEELGAAGQAEAFTARFTRLPVSLTSSTGLTMFVRRDLWDGLTSRTDWPKTPVQR